MEETYDRIGTILLIVGLFLCRAVSDVLTIIDPLMKRFERHDRGHGNLLDFHYWNDIVNFGLENCLILQEDFQI